MRIFASIFFLLIIIQLFGQTTGFYDEYDRFLSKYNKDGLIDYQAIKDDPEGDLDYLMFWINDSSFSEAEEKAYLINAYNISVINKVVNDYPVSSPMDISNFFDKKDVKLNGEYVSLNEIESKLLLKKYSDERFHFALVCGALGCPKIATNAFRPATIDEDLDYCASRAINDRNFVYQDASHDATMVSEIFIWYKDDFGGKNDSIFAFINKYSNDPFRTDFPIETYPYNWQLNDLKPTVTDENKDDFNIQTFTAGGLLGKGKFDLTLFNTLYTETKSNWLGMNTSGFRATFVTHLFQFTYGITKSKRLNLGFDLYLRNNGRSVDPSIKGLAPAFQYANTDSTRFGLTSVGIRLKWQPFKTVRNFTIQSTLSGPVIPNPEGIYIAAGDPGNRSWADWNRLIWWNQFFIDKTYSKIQIFAEADLLFRFGYQKHQIQALDIPLNLFVSYFATSKFTVYVMTQHVPRLTYISGAEDPIKTDWVVPMNYTASGAGLKYAITSNLNLEVLYTNFWRGKNTGLGSTFNLGIKYVRN